MCIIYPLRYISSTIKSKADDKYKPSLECFSTAFLNVLIDWLVISVELLNNRLLLLTLFPTADSNVQQDAHYRVTNHDRVMEDPDTKLMCKGLDSFIHPLKGIANHYHFKVTFVANQATKSRVGGHTYHLLYRFCGSSSHLRQPSQVVVLFFNRRSRAMEKPPSGRWS